MAKPKKEASPTTAPPAVSKFQAFETVTIARSALKKAPYNPRYIGEKAKTKLRGVLQKVGLVQPIVWNKRTGNIVGGHQRITQLDSLEGSPDYSLTVAVVDVDLAREKELNVLLNNQEVTGEWDFEKLKEVLTSDIDLMATGFDHAEFMKLFGEAPSQGSQSKEVENALKEQLDGIKKTFEKLNAAHSNMDDTDYYNVVVFGSHEERKEFLDEFGFEDNRYLDGRTLVEVFRELRRARDAEKAKLAGDVDKRAGVGSAENPSKRSRKP